MSHVNKPLGLVLSFLLPFVSFFLPSLGITQTQFDFLFCCSGQHSRGPTHSRKGLLMWLYHLSACQFSSFILLQDLTYIRSFSDIAV